LVGIQSKTQQAYKWQNTQKQGFFGFLPLFDPKMGLKVLPHAVSPECSNCVFSRSDIFCCDTHTRPQLLSVYTAHPRIALPPRASHISTPKSSIYCSKHIRRYSSELVHAGPHHDLSPRLSSIRPFTTGSAKESEGYFVKLRGNP
jgi:hypothetical protein